MWKGFGFSSWWLGWTLGLALVVLGGSLPAYGAPFLGNGKEYVTYVNGKLWVFAMEDNTQVTVRRVSNNGLIWNTTIAKAGTMVSRNISASHVQITANRKITVAVGEVGTGSSGNDAYAAYLISEKGTRVGKQFEGYTRSELFVYCYLGGNATPVTSVAVTDVSDQGGAGDDSITLTAANAIYKDSNVQIWHRNTFDDDQIRVVANRDCAVMVGHRIRTNPRMDWAVHVPSSESGDGGRALGKRFYFFAHRTMMVVPTQDNTKVTIRDLSDNNDSRSLTLRLNQFFSARPYAATYSGYTQINPSPANEFDDDFVEVVADKPVVVYVGPTSSDVNEYANHPSPLPMGNGKQRYFCYVQNGGASDLQILATDKQTRVNITTMAGARNDRSLTVNIGPGGQAWQGRNSGPNWWESASFRTEFIRVDSDKPILVLCGDFDKQSWQSFLPFEVPNRPPVIAVSGGTPKTVKENQALSFTITGSDPDNDTPLKWTFSNLPTGAAITGTGNTRTFAWTPTYSQAGVYNVTLRLDDSGLPVQSTTLVVRITVEDVNRAPAFASTPPTAATEDQPYTYAAKATDPDGQTITYTLAQKPAGATVNSSTGVISWTPGDADANAGFRLFVLRACDSASPALCDTQTWNVKVTNVNDKPVISTQPGTSASEGQAYVYAAKATDADAGDILTWSLKTQPAGATVDSKTGAIAWTPSAADAAAKTRTFVLEVCDNNGGCTQQTWTVTVQGINDPPKITSTPPLTVTVGTAYVYNAVAADPDVGDVLTWKLKTSPTGPYIVATTGQIRWYTPQAKDIGSHSMAIEVCDAQNACDTQTWTLKVQASQVNNPPSIGGTPATSAFVGEAYAFAPSVSDPDANDTHTWSLKSNPPGMTIDPTTGAIAWTPASTDFGKTYTVTVEVCDNGSPQACDQRTFQITVGQKCGVDKDCVSAAICVNQRCVASGCYQKACASGQICVQGTCTKNACLTQTCGPTTVCRPVDGKCVPLCPNGCPTGQICVNGTCMGDPCYNFNCASGERCDGGQCVKDPCATAGSNACRFQRVCAKGQCQDDPCRGVTCPSGGTCKAGQCYNPPTPSEEPPGEAVTEPPRPDAGEPTPEIPGEPVTEPPRPDTTEPAPEPTVDGGEPSVEPPHPDASEPSQPDTSEPSQPDVSEPSQPDVSEPSQPDVSEPSQPDTTEPGQPDTTEPVTPDVSESVQPDTGEPSQPDTGEPSQPDTGEPAPDTAIKDGGQGQESVLDDPGVIGGGCRCDWKDDGMMSGAVGFVLMLLGLLAVGRRRN